MKMNMYTDNTVEVDNDYSELSGDWLKLSIDSYKPSDNAIELSDAVIERYMASGDTTHLDDAVRLVRDALALKSLGLAGELVLKLSFLLNVRAECFGRVGDNDEAISLLRRALDITPDREPKKLAMLTQLGIHLQSRFRRIGELEDLEDAIMVKRRVVELAPDGHPDKPMYMNNLSAALLSRFERIGELEDCEAAISMQQRAVELTSDDHSYKPMCMSNLGNALRGRFERVGELGDLDAAISVKRRAVELAPDEHPAKLGWMNTLGITLQTRFERVGELKDLEDAIFMHRCAVELTPDYHPAKPIRMTSLGNALQSRFERVGDLGDLQFAILVQRRAVELTPDDHPNKPMYMSNLGTALQSRFERVGELEDSTAAISVQRRAVELTPDGHPDKPNRMSNLGNALQSRFERADELEDLQAAIAIQPDAVELTPDDHPDKPIYMSNLGIALQNRSERVGELGDLETAISAQTRAIELTPDDHPVKPAQMNNLSISLKTRFDRVGELGDLEAAISTRRRAIELMPDDHPDRTKSLRNLGLSFWSLSEQSHMRCHFESAYKCFIDAVTHSSGSPIIRFDSARNCVDMLAENQDFASMEMILQAHSHVLRLLPEVVWLGHNITRRYEESSKVNECVNDAVAAAIEYEALPQAVAWLEEGRSLVWSQILALRTPLDDLETHYVDLSRCLYTLQLQLQQSGHISYIQLESVGARKLTGFAPDAALDRHRDVSLQYSDILSKVRSCPGFENFLRPKPFSALLPSTELGDGYVVFVNVYQTRCDALILTPSGVITPVALPDLSLERANQLQLLWIEHLKSCRIRMRGLESLSTDTTFDGLRSDPTETRHSSRVSSDDNSSGHLLEHTWNWIVEPILKALELTNHVPSEPLPHITWCPTGPLTRIPLHAAGVYSDPNGPRVFNFVVSSYTPSLSALLRSSQGIANQGSVPSVLIVTQPATPGQPVLPGTVDECHRLRRLLSEADIDTEILNGEQAITAAVRAAIDQHSWVHLACHGSQHTGDATQSAFHLYDDSLSLSDLMRMAEDKAELAFLSACQTATGDRNNPEESVHLAAGMLAVGFKGVVATMWSIGDRDAPIVVEAYYKKLLELRKTGAVGKGQTGAAYALHEAVKVLRDHVGEQNFLSWAPFVHFGA